MINVVTSAAVNISIPTVVYDDKNNQLNVVIPQIEDVAQVPGSAGMPQMFASLRHKRFNPATGKLISDNTHRFLKTTLTNHAAVYNPDDNTIISKATLVDGREGFAVYDLEQEVFDTDKDSTSVCYYNSLANQQTTEVSKNIAIVPDKEGNFDKASLYLFSGKDRFSIIDRAGVCKALGSFVDKQNGMLFEYLFSDITDKGNKIDVFWSRDIGSFVYVYDNKTLKRIKTEYNTCVDTGSEFVLFKKSKNNKMRHSAVTKKDIWQAITTDPKKLLGKIKKSFAFGYEIGAVSAINASRKNYFISKEFGESGVSVLMFVDSGDLSKAFHKVGEIPKEVAKSSFLLTERESGAIDYISFSESSDPKDKDKVVTEV